MLDRPPWKRDCALAAAGVLALTLAGHVFWLHDDLPASMGEDVIVHLNNSVEFHQNLKEAVLDPSASWFGKARGLAALFSSPLPGKDGRFPNGVYAVTSLLYSVFGQTLLVARAGNGLYLLLLLWSVYALGRDLSGRLTGLVAASLLAVCPLIFEPARQYTLDLPLAAMVACSMRLLLECDGFARRRESLLLGACLGLGIWVKFQIVVYMALPLLTLAATALVQAHKIPGGRDRRFFLVPRLANGAIALGVATALACPCLWGRLHSILRLMLMHRQGGTWAAASYGAVAWRIVSSITFDPMGLPLFAAFLAGLASILASSAKHRLLLAAWALSGVVMMPLLLPIHYEGAYPATQFRYAMPALPGMVVIASLWLCGLKRTAARIAALTFLWAFGCVQFCAATFLAERYRPGRVLVKGFHVPCLGRERLRLILSSPAALLGWTPYGGDRRNREAPFQIDRLLDRMQKSLPTDRKTRAFCLTVNLSDQPSGYEDYLRYYLGNRSSGARLYGMSGLALERQEEILHGLDFLIVCAPASVNSWAEVQSHLLQDPGPSIPPSYDPRTDPRNMWRSPRGQRFLAQVLLDARRFELLLEQPFQPDYHWLVYKPAS